MEAFKKQLAERIRDHERQKRIPLSKKYPRLKKQIIFLRELMEGVRQTLNFRIKFTRKKYFFHCILARHQSVLRRRLGNSDVRLQEQKIINLQQAVKCLNGIIIEPNDVFSFWHVVGKPKYKKGYVDGMLLSNGRIIEGPGGGLCQLSNFLYWIFLHVPIETIERHHHSMDVFPDSGRTLPFGGGATILYNFVDLKVKNISKYPFQLKLWLTDNHLKGQIVSPYPASEKFHIFEKNHFFLKKGKKYFRYNEIFREVRTEEKITNAEKITTNLAPVLYEVTQEYLKANNFEVIDFTNMDEGI